MTIGPKFLKTMGLTCVLVVAMMLFLEKRSNVEAVHSSGASSLITVEKNHTGRLHRLLKGYRSKQKEEKGTSFFGGRKKKSKKSGKKAPTTKFVRSKKKESADYDVVILGGGFSGLYTAMRLGQAHGGENLKIAILEKTKPKKLGGLNLNGIENDKDACLGGRIQDFPFDCKKEMGCPESGKVWFALGPVRYRSSQGSFFLGQELGFQEVLEEDSMYDESTGSIGHDRGTYFSGGAIAGGTKLLQRAYTQDIEQGNIPDNLLDILLSLFSGGPDEYGFIEGNALTKVCDRDANLFHDIRQYIANVTGSSSGVEALNAAIRFKSPWRQNDAQGMLEWLDTDSFKSDEGWTTYPDGGMSIFVRSMYDIIKKNNYAEIMCGTKVTAVNVVDSDDGRFAIRVTHDGKEIITAKKVISTIPPLNMHRLGGNVFDRINRQKEARVFHGVEVVTCAAQYSTRWWDNLSPVGQKDVGPVDTWWSTNNCMQQMENFNSAYLLPSNTIRVLYVDESDCSRYWKNLIENTDTEIVGQEIQARLSEYFKRDIPREDKLECKIYSPTPSIGQEGRTDFDPEAGWHFLAPGATFQLGNNPSTVIERWAAKPLDNVEGFHMCGEAFTVRHGWVDGARTNCDLMLNEYLNVHESYLKQWDFSRSVRAECSAFCREDDIDKSDGCDFPERAILR